MGIYDTVKLKMRCPYCNKTSTMGFQTKDGDVCMHVWKRGDKFANGQYRFIDAIGSCDSFKCCLEEAKDSVWNYGYYGGFSRSFDVHIMCDGNGRITSNIKIIKLNAHKGTFKGKNFLNKFKPDNFFREKETYQALLFLLNEKNDDEIFFEKWFVLRHKLERILEVIHKQLKFKIDEEYASLFLSNYMGDILDFCEEFKER